MVGTSVAISSSGRPSSSNMGLNRKTGLFAKTRLRWVVDVSAVPLLVHLRAALAQSHCFVASGPSVTCWKAALVRWRIEGVFDCRRYLREFRLRSMECLLFHTPGSPNFSSCSNTSGSFEDDQGKTSNQRVACWAGARVYMCTLAPNAAMLPCVAVTRHRVDPVRWDLIPLGPAVWKAAVMHRVIGLAERGRMCWRVCELSHVTARAASPASLVTIFVHVSRSAPHMHCCSKTAMVPSEVVACCQSFCCQRQLLRGFPKATFVSDAEHQFQS